MLLFNILKQKIASFVILLTLLGKPFYLSLISLTSTTIFIIKNTNRLTSKLHNSFHLQKQRLHHHITIRLKSFYTTSHTTSIKKPKNKLYFTKVISKFTIFNPYLCFCLALSIYLCILFYYTIIYQLPKPELLKNHPQKLTTQIFDRNGQLLYKIFQDENRTLIKLSDLPQFVPLAFVAIEDKDFYSHHGFSIRSITRALRQNLISQNTLEGGSTITQQLLKNTLLNSDKTWERKLKEIILAVQTEKIYDKNTILEMYLNEVGFGGPAYGIEEASKQYFGISAKELSLPQAAFLAGLPKAPSRFSPYLNPQNAINRQRTVLNRMYEQQIITKEELESAEKFKLKFITPKTEIKAPHFVMYVRDLLIEQFGETIINHGGLKVTTTLDLSLQELSQNAINHELERLKNLNVTNGAALITVPNTGEILAMVGSKNYFDYQNDGQVNLTTSPRQPGSAVKPINYALALEKGITPNYLLIDQPIAIKLDQNNTWIPKNYDGRFHGTVTLRQALANSYNIPAILLLSKNGVHNMATLGQQLGITTWNNPSRLGLSLTLGGVEIKMTDMAEVYGTFANLGLYKKLNPFIKIEDKDDKNIPFSPCLINKPKNPLNTEAEATDYSCQQKQVLKPETAYIISDILSDNQARSSAFGTNSILNVKNHQVAVKTGTSNNLRDNWTFGYTPDFVVAVWVGNNNNSPMSQVASGITGASPIWNKIISSLLDQNPNNTAFTPPQNLNRVAICNLTGTLTCDGCPSHYEYFVKGSEPQEKCNPETIKNILSNQNSTLTRNQ